MKRGDRVRIPKGTVITGTFPEGIKEAKRSYTVTAFSFDPAYGGDPSYPSIPPRTAKVCWVGAGGYWCYAELADVEVLP